MNLEVEREEGELAKLRRLRERVMALPRVWAKLSRDYYDDAAPFIELVGEDKKDDILVMCEELIRAADIDEALKEVGGE